MVLNLKRFQKYIYIKNLCQGNSCSEKTLYRKKKIIFSIIYHNQKRSDNQNALLSLLTSKAIPLLWVSVINPQIDSNQVNIYFLQKIIKKKFEPSKVLNECFKKKYVGREKSQILTHPTRVCTKDIPFITTLCVSLKFPIGFSTHTYICYQSVPDD